MVQSPQERLGRRFDLGVLVGAWAFLFLLHPPPEVLWFDYAWIAYNLLPLPLTPTGMWEAIRWQATVHSPQLARPARAVQWWLAVKALGCGPLGYHVANVLTLGVAAWALVRVAWELTGRRSAAALVGACMVVSYATAFSVLFFGYGQPAAFAFAALALWLHAERRAPRRWWWQAGAAILLFGAALSHETYLAYALLPLAHAALVERSRAAVGRALVFAAVLPGYVLVRQVQSSLFGTAPSWLLTMLAGVRDSPGILL